MYSPRIIILLRFFFSFSLTCRLRGIESRPNERGDKALCNNVLSIWTRREEFSLSCTLRVSRYVTILLIGELLCFFFFFVKKLCKGMFVRFIINWYRKWCYAYFIWNWICCSCFWICSIDVKLFIYQFFKFVWWYIDIVNEEN